MIPSVVNGCQLFFFSVPLEPGVVAVPTAVMLAQQLMTAAMIFSPCTSFPQFLDELPLTLLWKLFKGQCVIEIVTGFLKHLQANYQLFYDAIRYSWL